MFRIECFVTDKHLPDVLRALGQRVMNLSVVPVVDAAVQRHPKGKANGELRATAGSNLEGFLNAMRKSGRVISRGSAELSCQEAGLKPSAAGYYLKKAFEAGAITKKGKGTGTTYAWATKPGERKSAGAK